MFSLPGLCWKELFYVFVIALFGFPIGTFNSPTGIEISSAWSLSTLESTIFNIQTHFFASVGASPPISFSRSGVVGSRVL
jgi:hypothetical protein